MIEIRLTKVDIKAKDEKEFGELHAHLVEVFKEMGFNTYAMNKELPVDDPNQEYVTLYHGELEDFKKNTSKLLADDTAKQLKEVKQ